MLTIRSTIPISLLLLLHRTCHISSTLSLSRLFTLIARYDTAARHSGLALLARYRIILAGLSDGITPAGPLALGAQCPWSHRARPYWACMRSRAHRSSSTPPRCIFSLLPSRHLRTRSLGQIWGSQEQDHVWVKSHYECMRPSVGSVIILLLMHTDISTCCSLQTYTILTI